MEKIDLNNYEAYFLDYMEGSLSEEEKHDLFAFLDQHPTLKQEMEVDFGAIELAPENVSFDWKDALKVDEGSLILTKNTVDEIMIASVEGQLSDANQQQLETYVAENNLQTTFAYYKATVLKPDTNLVYSDKQKLKVRTGIVISLPLFTRIAAAAAVGIILITLAVSNWNTPGTLDQDVISSPAFASDAKGTELLNLIKKRAIILDGNAVLNNENPHLQKRPDQLENDLIKQVQKDEIAVNDQFTPKEDTSSVVLPNNVITPEKIDQKEQDNFVGDGQKLPIPDEKPVKIEVEEEVIYASVHNRVKREEPYKMVTDMAESIVNRDVEFTRERNSASTDYVGYGFKLGKFEFERKKGR